MKSRRLLEYDRAKRAGILPAQQIAKNRLPIGFGNVSLDESAAEGPQNFTSVANWVSMSTIPIPDRRDETLRLAAAGPRTPYPVDDPDFADPGKPGSES